MSDVTRLGYSDADWVTKVARPRVRTTLLWAGARRARGSLNGQLPEPSRSRIFAAMGRAAVLEAWR